MAEEQFFIQFPDPATENKWVGSFEFNPLAGCECRVISSLVDPKTNLKRPIELHGMPELAVEIDLSRRATLIDLAYREQTLSMKAGHFSCETRFNANALLSIDSEAIQNMTSKANIFYVSSPIVFSFLDHHAYNVNVTKKGTKFRIQDSDFRAKKFGGAVFKSICFSIDRSTTDSADGNRAAINYGASAEFQPSAPMSIWGVLRVSQLFERLLFLLVGDHCGPMNISIATKRRGQRAAAIQCSSPLYSNENVVNGLERCWTLKKTDLNVAAIVDRAIATHAQISTPLELIIDARAETNVAQRFFRLVRAMEAISRNLMPKGFEEAPEELERLEKLVSASGDEALREFLATRVAGVFRKRNSLGYGIDFAKQYFPFASLQNLNKREITRLRNIEAHARAHSFSNTELNDMEHYNKLLDFACRVSLLTFLQVPLQQIVDGLPLSRFSWAYSS